MTGALQINCIVLTLYFCITSNSQCPISVKSCLSWQRFKSTSVFVMDWCLCNVNLGLVQIPAEVVNDNPTFVNVRTCVPSVWGMILTSTQLLLHTDFVSILYYSVSRTQQERKLEGILEFRGHSYSTGNSKTLKQVYFPGVVDIFSSFHLVNHF